MSQTIHVINPSSRSDTNLTEGLARSLGWTDRPGYPQFNCLTLSDGPNGISTARDSADAAPAVLRHIDTHKDSAGCAGFIVACFSDPGVYEARELTAKPVIGIGGAGLMAANALGDQTGTISVSGHSDAKIRHLARLYGLTGWHAGHRGLGLDYADLQHPERVTGAAIDVGRQLRDDHGAQVLLFAGAGLAAYVQPVQEAVGVPVIDPVQAAAGIVLSNVLAMSGNSSAQRITDGPSSGGHERKI